MKASNILETRFPSDVYSILPKTLVVALLVFAFTESWLITLAAGVPAGLLLHIIPNAYDCKVVLDDTHIRFRFFRPWFNREEVDLTKVDNAAVEPEQLDHTLKDIWWRSDSLWPLGNSTLKLFRGNHLVHTINFRTDLNDTRKLAERIRLKFPVETHTIHP